MSWFGVFIWVFRYGWRIFRLPFVWVVAGLKFFGIKWSMTAILLSFVFLSSFVGMVREGDVDVFFEGVGNKLLNTDRLVGLKTEELLSEGVSSPELVELGDLPWYVSFWKVPFFGVYNFFLGLFSFFVRYWIFFILAYHLWVLFTFAWLFYKLILFFNDTSRQFVGLVFGVGLLLVFFSFSSIVLGGFDEFGVCEGFGESGFFLLRWFGNSACRIVPFKGSYFFVSNLGEVLDVVGGSDVGFLVDLGGNVSGGVG